MQTIEIIFTLLVLYSATAVQGVDESCSGAVEAVTSAASVEVAQDMVFASMSSSSVGGVCGLDLSCCTLGAEEVLRATVTQVYQDSLRQLLQGTIPGCMNSSLPSDSVAFLEEVKASMVATMKVLWADNYLSDFDTVFDGLFNYVENGILKRDLCDLEKEYQSVYFEAYLAGFKSVLQHESKSTDPLSDPKFRACFYDYFTEIHGATIADQYHNVKQRYNMFLRYLQALDTSDQALKTVLNHVLSPECQDSLLRMTHCAQCAGVSDSSILPCKNLCQNVQRGCLVDIYELGYTYKKLYNSLKAAKDVLNQYDPFGAMQTITAEILKILDDFEDGYEAVATSVSSRCGVSFSTKKRSVPLPKTMTIQHSKLARRQTVSPLDTLADTVTCARSVYRLLQNVATQTCGAHSIDSDNDQCWNGTHVGSYNMVVSGKGRLSQPNNPEIELTNTTGLLYLDAIAQLKNITAQLDECTYNVEGCAIKLCNRTIPSPSDYNLGTDTRYSLFTVSVEEQPVVRMTSIASVISQTSTVVEMTSIASITSQTSTVVEATSIASVTSQTSTIVEATSITSVTSQTSTVVETTSIASVTSPNSAVVETTSIAILRPTPQVPTVRSTPLAPMVVLTTSPLPSYSSESSAITHTSSTVMERTSTLTSSIELEASPLEQGSGELEVNSSIVTCISSTLLITSLLLTMLL